MLASQYRMQTEKPLWASYRLGSGFVALSCAVPSPAPFNLSLEAPLLKTRPETLSSAPRSLTTFLPETGSGDVNIFEGD